MDILPCGLVQHGFHLLYLISTEVNHGEMNPAILLDAHFSKRKRQEMWEGHFNEAESHKSPELAFKSYVISL